MFNNAYKFNADIGGWDTSLATNTGFMFTNAVSFNQVRFVCIVNSERFQRASPHFAACLLTHLKSMTIAFQDISRWNVGKINQFTKMFRYAVVFNQVRNCATPF